MKTRWIEGQLGGKDADLVKDVFIRIIDMHDTLSDLVAFPTKGNNLYSLNLLPEEHKSAVRAAWVAKRDQIKNGSGKDKGKGNG